MSGGSTAVGVLADSAENGVGVQVNAWWIFFAASLSSYTYTHF